MSTQPCPRCGFPNRGAARYCGQCGIDLHGPAFVYVPLRAGQTLKSGAYTYRVLRPLGKGGMGAVYLVAQTLAGKERHCVIKEMLDYVDPADQEAIGKAQQRFQEEAATLVELNHVGIPQIYDYFSESGRNYIAMQFIEGESLDKRLSHKDEQGQWLKGSAQPVEQVVGWGIGLCRLLEYLAGRKPPVIHHDIKPANIILNKTTDEVRLVDFGTAKARLTVQPAGQMGMRKSSIYGTAGYAAPEMYPPSCESEPRSDVYALGATLYHLLTNDDPGDHPMDFPRLSALPANVREALERALDNDVGKRITAGEMRKALETIVAVPRVQPFVFPSGEQAQSAEELARLCDQNWEDAKQLLYQGSFEAWLRSSLFRNDLAGQAKQLTTRSDRNAALEQFLRLLDPNLPMPQPTTGLSRLDFGRIGRKKRMTKQITLSNKTARGYLYGQVKVDPPVAWLSVAPTTFSGNNVSLTITVDPASQAQGERLSTHLNIVSPSGSQEKVPVHVRVAFDWPRLLRSLLFFAVMGALLATASGYLTGQTSYRVQEVQAALAGLGLLSALVISLSMGSALGGPKRFSKLGCLFWLFLSIPVLGYLFLVLGVQFWSLRTAGGDIVAYIGIAILGVFIFTLLGCFRGLSKAGRKMLRWFIPLLLLIGCLGWIAWEPRVRLEIATYHWLDLGGLAPLFNALPDGRWQFLRQRLLATCVDLPVPYIVVEETLVRGILSMMAALSEFSWPWR